MKEDVIVSQKGDVRTISPKNIEAGFDITECDVKPFKDGIHD